MVYFSVMARNLIYIQRFVDQSVILQHTALSTILLNKAHIKILYSNSLFRDFGPKYPQMGGAWGMKI